MDGSIPYESKRSAPRGWSATPFDIALSSKLDAIQIKLDAQPRSLRRIWLRLRKWNAERKLPIGLEVR